MKKLLLLYSVFLILFTIFSYLFVDLNLIYMQKLITGFFQIHRGVVSTLYVFFVTYATLDNWKPDKKRHQPKHVLDRWIMSRVSGNIKSMTQAIEKYDAADAAGNAEIFIITSPAL